MRTAFVGDAQIYSSELKSLARKLYDLSIEIFPSEITENI